ncbi:CLUMA_CG018450, isoform A [Clunio marinus]|uniref:CLUMA_CG018450, isoform A n=1 Tax=Clunio marinus TaxID=568069 RepID=A0A1J1J3K6_9DIPT|nr:CLUMA_CG018450, isoform A [Clunio marinus]
MVFKRKLSFIRPNAMDMKVIKIQLYKKSTHSIVMIPKYECRWLRRIMNDTSNLNVLINKLQF